MSIVNFNKRPFYVMAHELFKYFVGFIGHFYKRTKWAVFKIKIKIASIILYFCGGREISQISQFKLLHYEYSCKLKLCRRIGVSA